LYHGLQVGHLFVVWKCHPGDVVKFFK
jgi:hypothetical protein